MRRLRRAARTAPRRAVAPMTVLSLAIASLGSRPAAAGLVSVTGSCRAEVLGYEHGSLVQSDLAEEDVPGTAALPPILARARLGTQLGDGTVVGGGSALALLSQPDFRSFAPINDAGLEVSAFTHEPQAYWHANGRVIEVREIIATPADAGGLPAGHRVRFANRVIVSGAMILAGRTPGHDLTGVETSFRVSITRSSASRAEETVLRGACVLRGGSAGSVQVIPDGAFQTVFLPLFSATTPIPDLAEVKFVAFPGVRLPYAYEALVNEPYTLTLHAEARVLTTPQGVGAAAVFGVPVQGIERVFARDQEDEAGRRLAATVAQRVDTTGRVYEEGARMPAPRLCGAVGAEAAWPAVLSAAACAGPLRRRRRAGR